MAATKYLIIHAVTERSQTLGAFSKIEVPKFAADQAQAQRLLSAENLTLRGKLVYTVQVACGPVRQRPDSRTFYVIFKHDPCSFFAF
jgi:hypothetical protein